MRWLIGILVILAVALVIQSGLLAFAAYVLLGVLLLTRLLTREGLSRVEAARVVSAEEVEAGGRIDVEVTVRNAGRLPLPWVLLEDQLPAYALVQRPAAHQNLRPVHARRRDHPARLPPIRLPAARRAAPLRLGRDRGGVAGPRRQPARPAGRAGDQRR